MKIKNFLNNKTARGLVSVALVAAVGGYYTLNGAFAATNATLSASSATVTKGGNTQVTINLNTGDHDIGALELGLSFPADKLKCVGLTTTGDFPVALPGDVCGTGVYVARARIFDTSSNPNAYKAPGAVIVVTFQSLNAGAAPVSFNSSTAILDLSNNPVATSFNNGTITVNIPPAAGGGGGSAPVASAPSTSTNKPGTGGGTSPQPVKNSKGETITAPTVQSTPATIAQNTPGADLRPPAISNVEITDIKDNGATVRWTTDEPANSVVDYGPTAAYGQTAQAGDLATTHAINIASDILQKGNEYHVRVKSTDGAGNTSVSENKAFQTLGYEVTVVVKDAEGQPVENAIVAYKTQENKTDQNGKAVFTNVGFGAQKFVVKNSGKTTLEVLKVGQTDDQGKLQPQLFEIKAAAGGISLLPFMLMLILLIAGAVYYFRQPITQILAQLNGPRDPGGPAAVASGPNVSVVPPNPVATPPEKVVYEPKPEIDQPLTPLVPTPLVPAPAATPKAPLTQPKSAKAEISSKRTRRDLLYHPGEIFSPVDEPQPRKKTN